MTNNRELFVIAFGVTFFLLSIIQPVTDWGILLRQSAFIILVVIMVIWFNTLQKEWSLTKLWGDPHGKK